MGLEREETGDGIVGVSSMRPMVSLTISSLAQAAHAAAHPPKGPYTHALQILAAGEGPFPDFGCPSLRLTFEDVELPAGSSVEPTSEQVAEILRFGHALPREARLAVHCFSGRSRSTAAALIVLSAHLGAGREEKAGELVLAASPEASPNRLMISLAEGQHHFNGRLFRVSNRLNERNRDGCSASMGGGWLA
jgi:predicted protein tyrosine phosphatase